MKKHKNQEIVQLRDDFFVNKDNIDSIIKTNIDPKDKSKLEEDIYVIYLKNSHYNWISINKEQFNKYLKHLIF
jgi:hypothetical protein